MRDLTAPTTMAVFLLDSCRERSCLDGGRRQASLLTAIPGTYYIVVEAATVVDEGPFSLDIDCRSLSEDQVRELATGEVFTARRGRELGLVDQIGDFNSAVDLAAQLGNTKPRVRWLRPRRGFGQRIFGRMGSRDSSLATFGSQLMQLMAGGIYYLEPSFMSGEYMHNGD